MPYFSQRMGIRPASKAIQRESLDEETRNLIWSMISKDFWTNEKEHLTNRAIGTKNDLLMSKIWVFLWKEPSDSMPSLYSRSVAEFRARFYEGEWWEVFDFIEALLKFCPQSSARALAESLNGCLEHESSAYRIVGGKVVEVADDHSIGAIDSAIDNSSGGVKVHLASALSHLSDRQGADYRASIKESISAVEAACQAFTGKPKATLGDCLKVIKKEKKFHPALEEALGKLYGYTSDAGGIRHAMGVGSEMPTHADALFMLVACSAFVNYVAGKAAELNISMGGS